MGSKKLKKRSGLPGLVFILGFILLIFFLWGRVHIDFAVQELQDLDLERESMIHNIEELQASVDALHQFQRISALALQQGLTFVDHSKRYRLPVDFSGLEAVYIPESGLQVAGFGPFNSNSRMQSVSPFEEE
jgi:hypothetical protein